LSQSHAPSPWAELGISRATYYRRRARAPQARERLPVAVRPEALEVEIIDVGGVGRRAPPPDQLQPAVAFSRTRDIWYGDARRIDAEEMDRLRRGAEKAEFAQAIAAIEFLTNKALTPPSSASHQVIANLHAALLAFQRNAVGEQA
jgi:hypothetical protein